MKTIKKGKMPFIEYDSEDVLKRVLKNKNLFLSLNPKVISQSENIIIVIGTPVDEHLNPEFKVIKEMMNSYKKYFKNGQLIILRSTVYPGTTAMIDRWFKENKINVDVAFCPERIAEGYAMKKLCELPQIVSSTTKKGLERTKKYSPFLQKN